MQAHTVGDNALFRAGSGADRAARAHTEGVNTPPAAHVLAELVLAFWQRRVARRAVIEAFVNFGLQVLRAEADGERLAFQRQTQAVQHGEGVPGAVADGQNQLLAGEAAHRCLNAGQRTVFRLQAGQDGVEPHLASQGFNFTADIADDAAQQVSTHMGLLPPGDIGGCAVVEERPGHERAERVADACGQLAVGKGPRTALTKLDVGVRVQFAGLFKMPDGPDALIQRRAAFQHERTIAIAGQQQRRKQARRAKAHDDRAVRQRDFPHRKIKF